MHIDGELLVLADRDTTVVERPIHVHDDGLGIGVVFIGEAGSHRFVNGCIIGLGTVSGNRVGNAPLRHGTCRA